MHWAISLGIMKNIILLTAILLAIVSCSDNAPAAGRTNGFTPELKTAEDSLFQSVMDDHDAAMAKMGKLAGLKKQVSQKADSLVKAGTKANDAMISSLQSLGGRLKSSEDKMNEWMDGFSLDSAKEDAGKRLVYLQSEKVKVSRVKTELLESVAAADSLLKKK